MNSRRYVVLYYIAARSVWVESGTAKEVLTDSEGSQGFMAVQDLLMRAQLNDFPDLLEILVQARKSARIERVHLHFSLPKRPSIRHYTKRRVLFTYPKRTLDVPDWVHFSYPRGVFDDAKVRRNTP